MHRFVLSLMIVSSACGVESSEPATPLEESAATLVPEASQPVNELVVHGLAGADEARVHWLLGIMSCGIFEVAHGDATLLGGSFSVPFESSSLPAVHLYVFVDVNGNGTCEASVDSVREAEVSGPGRVDLSNSEPLDCWVADSVIVRNP